MQLLYDVPEVEVYLKAAVDAETAPRAGAAVERDAVAGCSCSMEQAAARGLGAFPERRAARRACPGSISCAIPNSGPRSDAGGRAASPGLRAGGAARW